MGNAQLEQKLWFFIRERRRVYEAMMAVIQAENTNRRTPKKSLTAASLWNDLQDEYGRIERDIQDIQGLLARYRESD